MATTDSRHLAHNPDLALHESREHHHEHLHHSAHALQGRTDDVVYSKGTTDEPSVIPRADINDDYMHRHKHAEAARGSSDIEKPHKYEEKDSKTYDAEKGSIISPAHTADPEHSDPQRHKVSRFYKKYRIFFHLAILALFTGYVRSMQMTCELLLMHAI